MQACHVGEWRLEEIEAYVGGQHSRPDIVCVLFSAQLPRQQYIKLQLLQTTLQKRNPAVSKETYCSVYSYSKVNLITVGIRQRAMISSDASLFLGFELKTSKFPQTFIPDKLRNIYSFTILVLYIWHSKQSSNKNKLNSNYGKEIKVHIFCMAILRSHCLE